MIRHFQIRFHRALRLMLVVLCLAGTSAPSWAQFETRATHTLPPGVWSVATGDFNGDGKLDLVILDDGGFSVSLGNGDGTFQKATFYSTQLAYSLAVADFNNDGKLDIVVANENLNPSTVSVYLGNGDGTFQAPIDSNTTNDNIFVATGDFNGDGKMDIVVIDGPISVLLGNGDGTFQAPSDDGSFIGPQWLAVGDFNNDHKLDVVVVGFFGGSDNIGVLLGNGDGTLQNSLTYPLTYVPQIVATGDFNGDGNLDAAIADHLGGVTVLLGDGKGGFGPQTTYDTTGLAGGSIIVGDLNLDGKIDLALPGGSANDQVGGVDVFWGNGDGMFQQAPDFFSTGVSGLGILGDFNNDHLPDIVLANGVSGAITVLNTGVASFSSSAPMYFGVRLIGTQSQSQSVKLTNSGSSTLSISSFEVSGPFKANNACGHQLASGASCTISATYEPSKAGTQSGGITIVDSASSKPQFIELLGSGTYIVVSPTSLNFGGERVGTKSASQMVTVTNDSGSSIVYNNPSLGGADSLDFTETNNCTGVSIPPGGTCQVNVKFAPKEKGARAATLSIKPQGTAAPGPVALKGTGT
jgi:VCBS repeat protein/centrosomal CEP192-like protein/ASPM-SPD-2-Hydin domain-containing protein/FG-GAP repeat protein